MKKAFSVLSVLIVIGGAVYLVYYFSYMRLEIEKKKYAYNFSLLFTDVWSLYKDTKVRVKGHTIGVVKDIELWRGYVKVTVDAKEAYPIYKNYHVQIDHLNLVGGYYIDLDIGDPSQEKLYDSFANQVLMGKYIPDPITMASKIFAENRKIVLEITQNIKSVTEKIDRQDGTLGKIALNDKSYGQLMQLLNEAKILVTDMQLMTEMDNLSSRRSAWTRSVSSVAARSW